MAVTILLIDDSPTIRTITRIYLAVLGADFIEAGSGDKALEVMKEAVVNLIIADVKMPGMDGITFVQRLRELPDERMRAVPVILLTGDKSEDVKERGAQAGANAFLQKPVSGSTLLATVRQFLIYLKN